MANPECPRWVASRGSTRVPRTAEIGAKRGVQGGADEPPRGVESGRLRDETHLTDFRDAAQRSAPHGVAGDKPARGNRSRSEGCALMPLSGRGAKSPQVTDGRSGSARAVQPRSAGCRVPRQMRRMLSASGPLPPSTMSTATRWPSPSSAIPARFSAEACTKMSLPPRSRTMNPNPLSAA